MGNDDRIEFLVGAGALGAPSVSSRRVVAMRRRVLTAMVVAAGFASAGCAPAGSASTVTVTWTGPDGEQTVTMTPDVVDCDDTGARGTSMQVEPQGTFSFRTNVGEGARGSVGVGAESVLVAFESDDIDLTVRGDAVTVASSDGEAAVVEGWTPEDGIVESPDDATRYPATVTASLRCE